LRKKLLIFTILISITVIIISILYIGNGITDAVKESSKLRVYIWNNPLKLNLEWKDKILDVSQSSLQKSVDFVKSFINVNIVDRFMDSFVYRNVY